MAPIEFYHVPMSPPCRAVEMVAGMVGVKLNKHFVNLLTKEHLKDEYLRLNPLHKVPFIVDGDLKLGESRAIMMYLVNKYKPDNEHLYSREPKERALVDELLFYEIGTHHQACSKLFYPMLFGNSKLDPEAEKAYREVLAYLDKRLSEKGAKSFMIGAHLTIADISFAANFSLAEACDFKLEEFKSVVAYLKRLKAAIPNYGAINDEPMEGMRQFIKSKKQGA